ncbi:MAG: CRISPR-associated helicase Cas3' [Ruminococcus sp.]|nr:CRISPR-associated helicase Cas3' [Ruminococcus sp.]MCM1380898.1 CRISPR-associated helicase Cas3' [Muribaculaceae bacterium]MCM1479179.1 CRISPR-associated helicase Cas3' [Muribaculaceae bacterium]
MYIAHIRETDGEIQTVCSHSRGAAELAEKFSSGLNFPGIMRLAALLHDAGKMNRDFNDYIKGGTNFRRGEIDHSYAGAKFIIELSQTAEGENVRETALFIARIIVSHHGLHDWVDDNSEDYLKVRTGKNDRYGEILEGIKTLADSGELETMLKAAAAEYTEMKNKLFALCENNSVKYSFYMGMFERLAQSVLVDADRTDAADFADGIKPREFDASAVWEDMYAKLEEMCKNFRAKTDRVSLLRMGISDRCAAFANSERKICRLSVPTGGGKTVSSLRFAVNYCKKFGKEKIFYIAPFMSILEQNSEVLRSIAGDGVLLEHHSNIAAEIDGGEELNDYERGCERWENPVIATTAVQFLNTLFSGKMSSVRRFHNLANSVIIIDEVQSLPIKCVYLFNLAMNFLSRVCGSVIVLCTATQPALEQVRYPLLLDGEESMTGDVSEDFKSFKRTELISDIRTEQYTYEQAADYAYEKFLENKNLLMIMNTKKAAAELFKLLREKCGDGAEIIHLSTFMCPAHRKDRLDRVRGLLEENKPVICVTTQLIEAGVDISFNCVIRSAAGAESIAQAAGRCNRHGKDKVRPVYVINVGDEQLGSGLEQIKRGRDIFTALAGSFEGDLMSAEAVNLYYEKLYGEYRNGAGGRDELEYYAKNVDTSLLDFLSKNAERSKMCKSKLPYRAQAFATAGKLFQVIDENTRDIIVPYNGEAEKIILDLNSDISPEEAVRLLRKAQKYSVGIYPSAFDGMLEKGQIYPLKYSGVFALDKSCFSEELGIGNESVSRELLMF